MALVRAAVEVGGMGKVRVGGSGLLAPGMVRRAVAVRGGSMKASRVITHDRPSLAGRGSCDDPGCSDHPYATLTPHYGCPACGQSWSVLVTETKEDLAG